MKRKALEIAVTDLAEAVGLLLRRVRAAAASQEMNWTEVAVLKRLAREGPATTAGLARAQGMRPQSMRTIVAALEELGMVERKPHATDGRQVNIQLTDKGIAAEEKAGATKRNWLAQAIAKLDDDEQETLFAAGKIIKRLAEREQR
jgi:DNA-binding MarR family transcriptional regulator